MIKHALFASVALGFLTTAALAEDTVFPATLAAHAVLPANTIIAAPADAADYLKTSGKFTTPDRKRTEAPGTVPGKDGVRLTGLSLPSDTMLMLHNIEIDWDAGKIEALKTVFLTDPDKKAPFPIVMEGAAKRYLTGADFDVESIQPVADGFWVGEEFGPYILKFDLDGKLTEVVSTTVDGKAVTSPDNPTLAVQADPSKPMPVFNIKRSGGFEGLALSKDGGKLYGLLEGPIWTDGENVERGEGRPALRIVELDVASKTWTGRSWLYPLAEGGEAIGDFNMLDEKTALVIERDNGAGTADKACANPKEPKPDCFAVGAKVKRVYKIEMTDKNTGRAVRKIGYIDLLKIADPDNRKRQGGGHGFYDMPFVTIENVDRIDATHIVVGNDNNLPFSAGRLIDKADDNEFVLLEVGEFLNAK
jgi:hypothetical protein